MLDQMAPARDNGTGGNQHSTNRLRQAVGRQQQGDQLPPHSEEAEQGVLGCVLLEPKCLDECLKHFPDPEGFYMLAHRTLYQTLLEMKRKGQAIDFITLQQVLRDKGELENVGGLAYLSSLPDAVPSAANLEYYLEILRKQFVNRQVIQAATEMVALVGENPDCAKEIIASGATALKSLQSYLPDGSPVQKARRLSELVRPQDEDPEELIQHRFLCRGGGTLLCGPTGIGKSSFSMQCMVAWALGHEAFGMKPARPLKSLLIQAENDDGDLAEMRDGVIAGLGLTAEQAKQSAENVVVFCEDERTGPRFFLETVEPLLAEHRPDLVWIDPVLSYLGGETNSQKDVGAFLRNGLNPLLHEFKCGAIVVHHTNKPPRGEEKQNWAAGDFAYIGSGSAEWANWARAVIGLRSIGLHDVYELRAGKRGARLGWREADGTTKSFVKYIGHSLDHGKIYWREVEAPAVNPLGRPKRCREDEVFKILPAGGLPTTEWQKRAEQECGISRTSFFRLIDLLERNERILKSTISDKWQPILKTH